MKSPAPAPRPMSPASRGWVDRIVDLAESRAVIPVLLLVAIAETAFLPVPYEILFVALCLAAPKRIWLFVILSVLGSAVGCAIVYGLGATMGDDVARLLNAEESFATFQDRFQNEGGMLVFFGGLTPIPSFIVNLVAGASHYPFVPFVFLFTLSRLIRFAAIAVLIHFFGEATKDLWSQLPASIRWTILLVLTLAIVVWMVAMLL